MIIPEAETAKSKEKEEKTKGATRRGQSAILTEKRLRRESRTCRAPHRQLKITGERHGLLA